MRGLIEFGEYCRLPGFVQNEIDRHLDATINARDEEVKDRMIEYTIKNLRKTHG